jgi:hypothetical protein
MSDHYVRFNYECAHMFKWYHYLHHVVWTMTMPDLMMNEHTCITETTAYSRVYVRSLCHIYWWMNTHGLLIPLLTQCCMSDSMMNVGTYFTDSTTYTMLHVRSLREIQW